MNLSNANITTSISIVIGFLLLLLLPFEKVLVVFDLDEFKENFLGDSLKNILIILYGLILINRFGYQKISGAFNFNCKYFFLLLIPLYFTLLGPLEYILFNYGFQDIKALDVFILLFAMITVGLSEEVIFRGFVLPNLIIGAPVNQSLLVPLFTASLLFGVLHLLNLFQFDAYLPLVLSQVIYATLIGAGFGIILLRTRSLIPLGLLHGLINFSSNWDELPGAVVPEEIEFYLFHEAILSVLVVLPFIFYMIRELPKIDRKVIMNLYTK